MAIDLVIVKDGCISRLQDLWAISDTKNRIYYLKAVEFLANMVMVLTVYLSERKVTADGRLGREKRVPDPLMYLH